MSRKLKVGIAGAGWPGQAHARGYAVAGGYEIVAVADLIPERRKRLISEFPQAREFAGYEEMLRQCDLDVVSVCLPTAMHAEAVLACLKSGRHVLCETPPVLHAGQLRSLSRATQRSGKLVQFAFQRRFGAAEQATRQAVSKGYAGAPYHVRAAWMRTRAIPRGTGWYTDRAQSGGGALADLGVHLLDLGWLLLDQPAASTAFAVSHQRFRALVPETDRYDVEDATFALVRFVNGATLELSVAWAINQPPSQSGTLLRVHGDAGAIDVYTSTGPVLWRGFDGKSEPRSTVLPQPKLAGHAAMARHFRSAIDGKTTTCPSLDEAAAVMCLLDALRQSAQSGRSVAVKQWKT
jgi:predicted dehydrogenase